MLSESVGASLSSGEDRLPLQRLHKGGNLTRPLGVHLKHYGLPIQGCM
jgi:hypothetical protein